VAGLPGPGPGSTEPVSETEELTDRVHQRRNDCAHPDHRADRVAYP